MATDQPVRIETRRLILDAHCLEDFEALCALWSDPVVVRHIGGRPSTRQESWSRLQRYRGNWAIRGYGFWAVREKSTARYLGDIGFKDNCRDVEPSIFGVPEAGWVLAPSAHGQGFASEALAAALAWLDEETSHPSSVCLISPANAASIRLAEKHGYRLQTAVWFDDHDTILMSRPRPSLSRHESKPEEGKNVLF